jgi:hypothetical protein
MIDYFSRGKQRFIQVESLVMFILILGIAALVLFCVLVLFGLILSKLGGV